MKYTRKLLNGRSRTVKNSLNNTAQGSLSLFVEKVAKNLKDPKKGARYAVSVIRRLTRPFVKLAEPIYKLEREYLLKHTPENINTSRLTEQDLGILNYSQLRDELRKINDKKIDWNKSSKSLSKKSAPPKVSVIVLVLNNPEMTLRCIDSVMQSNTSTEFELIVVDNGSNSRTIKSLRKCKERYPELVLVHSYQNLNFSVGNNLGFTYASGHIAVFLNNDTYVTDGWLDQLIQPLGNKKVKAVQPALFYPDNTVQCVGVVFSDKTALGYGIYVNASKRNKTVVKSRKLQAVTGACLAVRASDFAILKGFDPSYINGQEDIDLCLRLTKERGTYCYCEVKSTVYHDEGKTKGRGKYVLQNRQTYLDRWSGVPKADDEVFYREDGYKVTRWVVDSDANTEMGLGVYTPIVKKERKA